MFFFHHAVLVLIFLVLLMLVAAFIADKKNLDEAEAAKELMRVYKHAIRKRYRFYSFGDAMLLV
jgi:S-adenosylmethionine:tRNA-ribosyltransferase-isomerase (queuine synthetase)